MDRTRQGSEWRVRRVHTQVSVSTRSAGNRAIDCDRDHRRASSLGIVRMLRVDAEAKYPIAALLLRDLIFSENFSV